MRPQTRRHCRSDFPERTDAHPFHYSRRARDGKYYDRSGCRCAAAQLRPGLRAAVDFLCGVGHGHAGGGKISYIWLCERKLASGRCAVGWSRAAIKAASVRTSAPRAISYSKQRLPSSGIRPPSFKKRNPPGGRVSASKTE